MNTKNQNEELVDFRNLKSGTNDPSLNKFIRAIIIQHRDYVVYLDNALNTQWHIADCAITPALGKILNQVAILEFRSDFLDPNMMPKKGVAWQLLHKIGCAPDSNPDPSLFRIRSLLGEAIARVFDGNDSDEAQTVLNEAERLISAKNAEYARAWYYKHAFRYALAAAICAIVFWFARGSELASMLGKTGFDVLFCSLFGVIGAYVFVAKRGEKIELDAVCGPAIHKLEADARLTTGMVAAAVTSLAIKTGLLFPTLSQSGQLKFMVIASILAGYSERFIPNIVKKLDPSSAESKASKQKT